MNTYKVYVVIEEYNMDLDEYQTFGEELIDETGYEESAYEIRDRAIDAYRERELR